MRRVLPSAAAAMLVSRAVLADGITGLIEGDYTRTRQDTGDQSGGSVRNTLEQFTQRYRLALDRAVFPLVRVNLGGTFEQFLGTANTGGIASDIDSRTEAFFGSLSVGSPMLSAVGGYSWREQTAATITSPYGFVSETANLLFSWRPTDLPSFSLLLARPAIHDRNRQLQDLTTWQALFNVAYDPVQQLSLRYTLDYQNPHDALHETETTTVTQSAQASYNDRLLGGRSTVAITGMVRDQRIEVQRSGAGGRTATPVAPIAGYSLVEAFPATPDRDTLVPNAALINGDVTASAGLDIGTSPSLSGDVSPRDIGVQFADAATGVNTLWIWVDKQLPPAVAASLEWSVWASADNQLWSPIALFGPVVPNPFETRFEIPIVLTEARYLKVVVKPLAAGSTVDPLFRDVFVTEIQTLLVTAVSSGHSVQSSTAGSLSANARTMLYAPAGLAHDISLFATLGSQPGLAGVQHTYQLTNGLSVSRKLLEALVLSARVARQDAEQASGHMSEWLWSASLAAMPLPGLSGSLVYGGKHDTGPEGPLTTNTVSFFGQAAPYRGVGFLANVNVGVTSLPTGQDTDLESETVSATLQPHSSLTLAGSFGHSSSRTTGGGLPRSTFVTNRVEGTATFTPVRALYISAGVSRTVTRPAPVTLANASVNFSPFPGGDLQLGIAYNQTLEPDGSVTRLLSPSLRWNVRRAIVTVTYTLFDSDSQVTPLHSRTFDVNLRIPL